MGAVYIVAMSKLIAPWRKTRREDKSYSWDPPPTISPPYVFTPQTNQPMKALIKKTSQELRMLSSVTLNCQVTKIVMNLGYQLSEL